MRRIIIAAVVVLGSTNISIAEPDRNTPLNIEIEHMFENALSDGIHFDPAFCWQYNQFQQRVNGCYLRWDFKA